MVMVMVMVMIMVMVMVMPGCVAPDRGGCGAAPATSCPHLHKKVGSPIFHQLVHRPHTLSLTHNAQTTYFIHIIFVSIYKVTTTPSVIRNSLVTFVDRRSGDIHFIHVIFLGFVRTYKI